MFRVGDAIVPRSWMHSWLGLVLVPALVAAGCSEASPPLVAPAADEPIADAGPDGGCGLSFAGAVEAYAPERVCQTTVYDLASGYCTFWQRCSDI